MKQVIFFIVLLTLAEATYSQKIILYRNTGGDQIFELSTIDSIKFYFFVCGDDIDYQGKTYPTVLIGSQCWLKENLNVGTMITGGQAQSDNGIIEKWCYNNDPANCIDYGGLYTWGEAMQHISLEGSQGICPDGWHIPTIAEFLTLKATVNSDGNALKREDQGSGAGQGTNTSGFSALLAGGFIGYFADLSNFGTIWSSTEDVQYFYPYLMVLRHDNNQIAAGGLMGSPGNGYSIRCIKD